MQLGTIKDNTIFEQFLNESDDLVFIVQMRDGKLVFANNTALERLGYTLEEMLEMPVSQWRQPLTGHESYREHLHRLKETRHFRSYGILTCKDGSRFEVETSARHTVHNGVDYNFAIARDISDRMAKEQAQQSLLISQALDSIQDAAFLARKDGTFAYFNATAANNLGYSKEELMRLHVIDIDPETDASVWERFWPILEEQKSIKFETMHQRKDGSIFPVEVVANHITFNNEEYNLGIARDISEKKAYEEKLKTKHRELLSREQELNAIIENIPHMLFMKEVVELRFVRFNKAGEALLGIPRQKMIGKNDYDFFPREQADFFTQKDREVINTDAHLDIAEEPIHTANGIRYLHTKKCVINDAAGTPKYLLGISEDISERKALEDELRQSEARFRDISESTNDAIWEMDADSRYTYASEGVHELLGYTPAEVLGKTPFDFMAFDEAERIRPIVQGIVAEKKAFKNLENENLHKNGRKVVVETSGTPVLGPDGTLLGYRGTGRDITERKEAQSKLEYERTFLKTLINTIPDLVWLKDEQGVYLSCNKRFESLYGAKEEDILGKTDYDFVDKELADSFRRHDLNAMHNDKPTVNEEVIPFADGHEELVETTKTPMKTRDGKLVGILGIAHDITNLRKAERDLQTLNEELEARVAEKTKELQIKSEELEGYFNTISDGLAVVDMETRTFVNCNKALEVLTGYTKEELRALTVDEIHPKASLAYVMEQFEKQARGEIYIAEKLPILHKNGNITLCDVGAKGYRINDKFYNIGVFRDATERLKLEAQLREEKEKAEAATRVKSDFLANMSHEIRTPMNAIIGMTHLALREQLDDKSRNYVSKASMAAKDLLGIINDILDFSKMESGKLTLAPAPFKLADTIKQTLHLFNVTVAEKEIRMRVKIDKAVPKYYNADALRLGQVLTNLLNNAFKFSHNGGSVSLEVSLRDKDATGALIRFSVIDEGIGISEANQKKLFQPFSQSDASMTREFGGTGLGLAISKNIVELMGGTIRVESRAEKGSTFSFTVRMPTSDAGVLKQEDLTAQPDADRLRGLKMLLVEDNAVNQELIMDLLKSEGVTVVAADNGKMALEMLEKETFDGVLMDCQMPVMDGYETTRRIRKQKRYRDLPILALTANAMASDRQKVLDVGMDDHISKPINPAILFDKIYTRVKSSSSRKESHEN